MTPLYPPIAPFAAGHLPVSDRHQIYWEECGNPDGDPVIFLHGGPGAGATVDDRRYFDPAHYRILVFDQRGSGRSLPLGEIEQNTTDDLIADIDLLRSTRGCNRVHVFGGSWGSALAIAYAERYPQHVKSLILRGIFLARQSEIDWYLYGTRKFVPEAWNRFAGFLPEGERADLLAGYRRRLTSGNPAIRLAAARSWGLYEAECATLRPDPAIIEELADETVAIGLARMNVHYLANRCFLAEGALLNNLGAIRHIPATIVQGRYDVVCPIETADELARAWPEAEYVVIADAGHSATEPGIRAALVAATDRVRAL